MAIFNPNVPDTPEPNYMGYSKGTPQPEVDKTAETALKGVGDLFSMGVKAVDQGIKENLSDQIFAEVDATRDSYTRTLEAVKSGTASVKSLGGNIDLVDEDAYAQEVPDEVQAVGQDVDRISQARSAGRLSNTDYIGRLRQIAKSYRSQYPGQREFIDSKISAITGMNPANAYISSLSRDIASSASAGQSEVNKTNTFIRQNINLPKADQIYDAYNAGRITTSDVNAWANKHLGQKWDADQRKRALDDLEGQRTVQQLQAKENVNINSANVAANYFDDLFVTMGIGGKEKMSQVIAKAGTGNLQYSDEQWTQLGQQIEISERQARMQLAKEGMQIDPVSGRTMINQVGGRDEYNKIVDANMELFRNMKDAILQKDVGLAFSHKNMAKAMTQDQVYGLMKDKDMGGYFGMISGLKEIGTDAWSTEFVKNFLKGKMPEQFNSYVEYNALKIATQPDIRTAGAGQQGQATGTPFTFKAAVEEAQAKKIKMPEIYQKYVDTVDYITKPDTPDKIRMNIARAAFSPGNQGFISKFDEKGRYPIYEQMTSPAMSKEMFRLGQQNPSLWRDYVNWAERSFAHELYSTELKNMNDAVLPANTTLQWDNVNQRFGVYRNGQDMTISGVSGSFLPGTVRTIGRLNPGLQNLANIARAAGRDPNEYVLSTMMKVGYRPERGIPQGVPAMIQKELEKSIAGPTPEEQKQAKEQKTKKEVYDRFGGQ